MENQTKMGQRLPAVLLASGCLAASAAAPVAAQSLVEMNPSGRAVFEFVPIAGTECWRKIRLSDGVETRRVLVPAGFAVESCEPPEPDPDPNPDPGTNEGDFDSEDLRSAPNPSELFEYGLWHRDASLLTEESWPVRPCVVGGPTLTATRDDWSSSFALCDTGTGNFLLRTAVGDTSGYSVGWFTPRRTFTRVDQPSIAWEVNLTDLGGRQWWEVIVLPADDTSHFLPLQDERGDGTDCRACTTIDWLTGVFGGTPYGPDDIVVGNGPFGGSVNLTTVGVERYEGWQGLHGEWGLLDPGQSNGIDLFRFEIVDNFDGTLTIDYGGRFTQVVPGSLPESYVVIFKDHNYTPDKDGDSHNGYTWFWDQIRIH